MRGIVSIVLLFAYAFGGSHFWWRAMLGRRDVQRPRWGFDIFRPELFTAEGQADRRLAARFYLIGAPVLIVALWLLAHV